jgi:hypothetical protein
VGAQLLAIWGNGLPPGNAPFERLAEHAQLIDDSFGRSEGFLPRGDGINAADVRSVLFGERSSEAATRIAAALCSVVNTQHAS